MSAPNMILLKFLLTDFFFQVCYEFMALNSFDDERNVIERWLFEKVINNWVLKQLAYCYQKCEMNFRAIKSLA